METGTHGFLGAFAPVITARCQSCLHLGLTGIDVDLFKQFSCNTSQEDRKCKCQQWEAWDPCCHLDNKDVDIPDYIRANTKVHASKKQRKSIENYQRIEFA